MDNKDTVRFNASFWRSCIATILKCSVKDIKIYSGDLEIGDYARDSEGNKKGDEYIINWVEGAYSISFKSKTISTFRLVKMHNCCGICVSTSANVNKEYQGKGLGTVLNKMRIEIARYLGYGLLLCTDIENNTNQRKILKRNGWNDVHNFINPRTKNRIYISVINL